MALLEFVATVCCALFSGAAVYVNFVEHPARMACGTELAATVFPVSYRRATVMQASLAALGLSNAVGAWLAGSSIWWLAGGLLPGSVLPFTLLVMMPTNNRLSSPTLDKKSASTSQLLSHWNNLHAVRSLLSVLALLVFVAHA